MFFSFILKLFVQPTIVSSNKFAIKRANQGFTLVEILVVVVMLSLLAGMMAVSVGTSDTRKNKAFYEHLQSNIDYIRLLSVEQMQPYGLAIKLAKQDSLSELVVVKLAQPNASAQTTTLTTTAPSWQLVKEIEPLTMPNNVNVQIAPLENLSMNTTNSTNSTATAPNWLIGDQAPPVVWFGTGEATPVQISVVAQNADGNRYPVGEPIIINSAGALESVETTTLPTTTGAP